MTPRRQLPRAATPWRYGLRSRLWTGHVICPSAIAAILAGGPILSQHVPPWCEHIAEGKGPQPTAWRDERMGCVLRRRPCPADGGCAAAALPGVEGRRGVEGRVVEEERRVSARRRHQREELSDGHGIRAHLQGPRRALA